jgi:hypothetical protein
MSFRPALPNAAPMTIAEMRAFMARYSDAFENVFTELLRIQPAGESAFVSTTREPFARLTNNNGGTSR